jgi:pyruvate kinase
MNREDKFRSTKIIATIGQSCTSYDSIRDLTNAGVDIFQLSDPFTRMNAQNQSLLERINRASIETGKRLGVMMHLKESDFRLSIMSAE